MEAINLVANTPPAEKKKKMNMAVLPPLIVTSEAVASLFLAFRRTPFS